MTRFAHSSITTPTGERLVLMTQDEYDVMMDALEVAAADRTKTSIARGEQETLTPDEPLAFWRQKRGQTQVLVAEAAGISQQYLSGLEAGKRKGDPALFKRLARVLRTRIEDLVDDDD
jgi:DNA-binding XRE family transcriptional regulator